MKTIERERERNQIVKWLQGTTCERCVKIQKRTTLTLLGEGKATYVSELHVYVIPLCATVS